jgi:hypothetical protein
MNGIENRLRRLETAHEAGGAESSGPWHRVILHSGEDLEGAAIQQHGFVPENIILRTIIAPRRGPGVSQ